MRDKATLSGDLTLQTVHTAPDGTRKLLSTLAGDAAGAGSVETVLIPVVRRQGERKRITVCVSSQIGCAMNCQVLFPPPNGTGAHRPLPCGSCLFWLLAPEAHVLLCSCCLAMLCCAWSGRSTHGGHLRPAHTDILCALLQFCYTGRMGLK